ncbi:hypothetical protein A2U01_0065722, partial [Trifolium medium]|nr:hypothetical protein [Trifolium medium]
HDALFKKSAHDAAFVLKLKMTKMAVNGSGVGTDREGSGDTWVVANRTGTDEEG